MKVTVKSLTDEAIGRRDYCNALAILIDGKEVFSVWDGEPEDATLSRDFNACWSIPEMLHIAYLAGRSGQKFEIKTIQVDEI